MRSKKDILEIKKRILEEFKDAKSELKFRNLYELLVCVMLSAQCTDKRVNLITPALFEAYKDVYELASANLASLKLMINSCSFFNNKAVNLIKMANSVVKLYNGEIPLDEEKLKALAGVGQKTAHVVLLEATMQMLWLLIHTFLEWHTDLILAMQKHQKPLKLILAMPLKQILVSFIKPWCSLDVTPVKPKNRFAMSVS